MRLHQLQNLLTEIFLDTISRNVNKPHFRITLPPKAYVQAIADANDFVKQFAFGKKQVVIADKTVYTRINLRYYMMDIREGNLFSIEQMNDIVTPQDVIDQLKEQMRNGKVAYTLKNKNQNTDGSD
jgi:hypothetical protein